MATADLTATPPINVTPAAAKFIQRMVRFGGRGENAGFRLEVSPGGCSGMSAQFSVEGAPGSDDHVVVLGGGITLFVPPKSFAMLEGVTIDFVENAMESRLAFIDPKAQSCGCGSSESKVYKLS